MCNFISCVVTRDMKVWSRPRDDSHHEIMRYHGLDESKVALVEMVPRDEGWRFILDSTFGCRKPPEWALKRLSRLEATVRAYLPDMLAARKPDTIGMGLEHERVIMLNGSVSSVKWSRELPHDRLSCLAEARAIHGFSARSACENMLHEVKVLDAQFAGYSLPYEEIDVPPEIADESLEPKIGGLKDEESITNLIRGCGLHIHFSFYRNGRNLELNDLAPFAGKLTTRLNMALKKHIKGLSGYRRPQPFAVFKNPGARTLEFRSCIWKGQPEALRDITRVAYRTAQKVVDETYS